MSEIGDITIQDHTDTLAQPERRDRRQADRERRILIEEVRSLRKEMQSCRKESAEAMKMARRLNYLITALIFLMLAAEPKLQALLG